jgi:hypothetical protein
MKISTFHLMPHRELPDDFEQRYQSVWVTPSWETSSTHPLPQWILPPPVPRVEAC